MKEDPDTVCLYIPLMKDLNMSWHDIKSCSRAELNGLLSAYHTYETMHAFDGYTSESIGELAKNDSSVHGKYARSRELRVRMEERMGIYRKKPAGFKQALGIK
jgi:hypothetical protein